MAKTTLTNRQARAIIAAMKLTELYIAYRQEVDNSFPAFADIPLDDEL